MHVIMCPRLDISIMLLGWLVDINLIQVKNIGK